MPESAAEAALTISKQNSDFPDYLDFQYLRQLGIDHLQKLSGKLWTDYNLHDPGVTLLEVLCYAITDLGYRNNLDIKDLLAPASTSSGTATTAEKDTPLDDNFFTPDQILTCNPVTLLDIRKRLIDIQGVRNAWIVPKQDPYDPTIYINRTDSVLQYAKPPEREPLRLHIKGLYTVLLDFVPEVRQSECGQSSQPWEQVLAEVKAVLHSYRNLCEDIYEIVVLDEEEIALQANIELTVDADEKSVLVEIYLKVQDFLAPHLHFYTLQEMLDKGKRPDEIFAGRPSALPEHDWAISPDLATRKSHGFIDPDELDKLELPKVIRTSDLYQIILNVPGVVAIRSLNIASALNGHIRVPFEAWSLKLTAGYRPVLGIDYADIRFFKRGFPVSTVRANPNTEQQQTAQANQVKRRYQQQQIIHLKAQRDAYELNLAIPTGIHRDIADHYSIHHDLPLVYGVGEAGLPDTASTERKAKAKQLKAYLAFFDQVLANYLSQLSQVRSLFSWDTRQWHYPDGAADDTPQQHTYRTQALNFPGVEEIVCEYQQKNESGSGDGSEAAYTQFLQSIVEDSHTAYERRNHFLDHLLARFSETFTDHTLLNYAGDNRTQESQLLHSKADFLQDYPAMSRDRFRAMNYSLAPNPNVTDHLAHHGEGISGFQRRIERLLGIHSADKNINENVDETDNARERFYVLEHILLRPQPYFSITEDGTLMPDSPTLLPIETVDIQWDTLALNHLPAAVDPYSFWVSIIFPASPPRFGSRNFRQLIERTLRSEAPAHVVLKIGWFNPAQMKRFEAAYHAWRAQLALKTREGSACHLAATRDTLVSVLSELHSDFSPEQSSNVDYRPPVLTNEIGETLPGIEPFTLDNTLIA
ncbi:MAG: hypothetical protein AB8B99_17880 [Phormidesmis sp.]